MNPLVLSILAVITYCIHTFYRRRVIKTQEDHGWMRNPKNHQGLAKDIRQFAGLLLWGTIAALLLIAAIISWFDNPRQ